MTCTAENLAALEEMNEDLSTFITGLGIAGAWLAVLAVGATAPAVGAVVLVATTVLAVVATEAFLVQQGGVIPYIEQCHKVLSIDDGALMDEAYTIALTNMTVGLDNIQEDELIEFFQNGDAIYFPEGLLPYLAQGVQYASFYTHVLDGQATDNELGNMLYHVLVGATQAALQDYTAGVA